MKNYYLNQSIFNRKFAEKLDNSNIDETFIQFLSAGYRNICESQKPTKRPLADFFGLRDFYR